MSGSTISLGCYAQETAFRTTKRAYAASPTSYIAALEISDPSRGKHPVVLVHYAANKYEFVEFNCIEDAIRECDRLEWGRSIKIDPGRHGFSDYCRVYEEYYSQQPGFRRFVELEPGQLPWFYAPSKDLVEPALDYVDVH